MKLFKCNKTNKDVGILIDGMAYVTDDFCFEQHTVNVPVISISSEALKAKILEESDTVA